MTELTDDHITLIIGGSLGGFFLSVISFIMRKYIKSSKCHNSFLGDLEINTEKGGMPPKPPTTSGIVAIKTNDII